jgi:hypothetical protein
MVGFSAWCMLATMKLAPPAFVFAAG